MSGAMTMMSRGSSPSIRAKRFSRRSWRTWTSRKGPWVLCSCMDGSSGATTPRLLASRGSTSSSRSDCTRCSRQSSPGVHETVMIDAAEFPTQHKIGPEHQVLIEQIRDALRKLE